MLWGKGGAREGRGAKGRGGGGGGDTLSCCVTCCFQSAKRLCCPCANQSIVERFQYNCIQNSLTWYKFKNQQQQATNHNHLPSKMKCKTMAAFRRYNVSALPCMHLVPDPTAFPQPHATILMLTCRVTWCVRVARALPYY